MKPAVSSNLYLLRKFDPKHQSTKARDMCLCWGETNIISRRAGRRTITVQQKGKRDRHPDFRKVTLQDWKVPGAGKELEDHLPKELHVIGS